VPMLVRDGRARSRLVVVVDEIGHHRCASRGTSHVAGQAAHRAPWARCTDGVRPIRSQSPRRSAHRCAEVPAVCEYCLRRCRPDERPTGRRSDCLFWRASACVSARLCVRFGGEGAQSHAPRRMASAATHGSGAIASEPRCAPLNGGRTSDEIASSCAAVIGPSSPSPTEKPTPATTACYESCISSNASIAYSMLRIACLRRCPPQCRHRHRWAGCRTTERIRAMPRRAPSRARTCAEVRESRSLAASRCATSFVRIGTWPEGRLHEVLLS
jgi:hypothetical protein